MPKLTVIVLSAGAFLGSRLEKGHVVGAAPGGIRH
jgi:hypothetical protein